MQGVGDATLMAYVDGELDAAESTAFEARLQAEPELRRQVAELRQLNAALGIAFNQPMHEAMPPLRAFEKRQRTSWWQWLGQNLSAGPFSWQPAAALALVLVSAGGGYLLAPIGPPESAPQSISSGIDAVSLNRTLETELSGTTVVWQRGSQGDVQGTLQPVRTFKSEQGEYCREYLERQLIEGGWREQRGIACRTGEANWQVRAHLYL